MPRAKNRQDSLDRAIAEKSKEWMSKYGPDARKPQTVQADWREVDMRIIATLLPLVADVRGAVMLGLDRNGVGYTVGIWIAGQKVFNRWYRGDAEGRESLYAELDDFCAGLEELGSGG